jgi:hypothetical protein
MLNLTLQIVHDASAFVVGFLGLLVLNKGTQDKGQFNGVGLALSPAIVLLVGLFLVRLADGVFQWNRVATPPTFFAEIGSFWTAGAWCAVVLAVIRANVARSENRDPIECEVFITGLGAVVSTILLIGCYAVTIHYR